MRLVWLADVLRQAGLTVVEHRGWKTRGRDLNSAEGVVCHHTATGTNWTDERVAQLLIKGRSDLPGPLSHLGLDRQGRFHVIAAGRANHNGYGMWGNQSVGIEAFNDGIGEPWPDRQVAAYVRGCVAICRHVGWPPSKVRGHKETDPLRKIDPRGIDMDVFRALVALQMFPPTVPPAAPIHHEADMATTVPVDIELDSEGRGNEPTGLDLAKLISLEVQAPVRPNSDGYYPGDPARINPQVWHADENGKILVIVRGGEPHKMLRVRVTVAD